MSDFLQGSTKEKFIAIQRCLVPRSQSFTESQWKTSIETINGFLANKPDEIKSKIKLFLTLIDVVSIFTKGSKFRNLNEQAQEKVMNFFFDSPIGLFRKGFWGLNTLCKLGVYSQQSIYADIGYRLRPIKGVRESVENTSRKEANL